MRWIISLAGLGLLVGAIVALTGPGRIDIEDGQARFEVGQNLVDHGDPAIQDPRVHWSCFPGRDGKTYSYYRFPQELLASVSVLIADATGPRSEGRRHFFFSLHGAVLASMIAILLAIWFRCRGYSDRASLGWAAAGVFTSPCWYYSTTTYDDVLCALIAVSMILSAVRARHSTLWLIITAVLVGLAFNAKPPLVAFALPAAILLENRRGSSVDYLIRLCTLALGFLSGYATYVFYHRWKFPAEIEVTHRPILAEKYVPPFFGNPIEAGIDYLVGPSSGMLWYFPPLLLCIAGVMAADRRVCRALLAACVAFVGFLALMTIYKGGICWGPRYLTPMFVVLWMFAPEGVERIGVKLTKVLLVLGVTVQVLALSLVPERLYVEQKVPTGFFMVDPWLYLRPEIGHLFHRPREIVDAAFAPPAREFTPAPSPTFTMPVFDPPYYPHEKGISGIRRFTLLNQFRPWWATFPELPADQRPVALAATFWLLAGIGGAGATCLMLTARTRVYSTPDLIPEALFAEV